MNRRNFLVTLPAIAVAAELLIPKKTIFLPPRCGWVVPSRWAVQTGNGDYIYSNRLTDFTRHSAFDSYAILSVGDDEYLTPTTDRGLRRWSGDYHAGIDRVYSWDQLT